MKSAAKYDTEDKPSELKQMRSEKYKQLHKKTVQMRQKAIQIHVSFITIIPLRIKIKCFIVKIGNIVSNLYIG